MKKRFLAVDQGNSLLKLTLFAGDEIIDKRQFGIGGSELVFAALESWCPDCAAFCSVGKIDPRLVETLRMALDDRLLIVSHSTQLPIGVDYATPETLGIDRLVLAVAASSIYKGETLAVIDAGTAVTLDVVDSRPAFKGGRITAGVRLRFESLHDRTAALPMVKAAGEMHVIGRSTEECIRCGVVMGLADEITECFRRYHETYGCERAVLTGGDAALISRSIGTRIPFDHVADLMALGLLYIYRHNE